jgi:hypothetical protein
MDITQISEIISEALDCPVKCRQTFEHNEESHGVHYIKFDFNYLGRKHSGRYTNIADGREKLILSAIDLLDDDNAKFQTYDYVRFGDKRYIDIDEGYITCRVDRKLFDWNNNINIINELQAYLATKDVSHLTDELVPWYKSVVGLDFEGEDLQLMYTDCIGHIKYDGQDYTLTHLLGFNLIPTKYQKMPQLVYLINNVGYGIEQIKFYAKQHGMTQKDLKSLLVEYCNIEKALLSDDEVLDIIIDKLGD